MTVRVLVVDDSSFFRNRLKDIFQQEGHLEVIDVARNGQEAVDKTLALKPDVITMDVEMPVMDGITAVRKIMEARPTPILMLSALTQEGAKATLDALDAGALDFIPKSFDDIASNREEAHRIICDRVRQLGLKSSASVARLRAKSPPNLKLHKGDTPPRIVRRNELEQSHVLVIGASTGGPAALQKVLTELPQSFSLPILIIQHMPAAFTGPYAHRLDKLCNIKVKEAVDGDLLVAGVALVAPGGKQMVVVESGGRICVRIRDGLPGQIYKPSVDVCFSSVAKVFGGKALAVVLTGMGADGRAGATDLKRAGSTVWAQDEHSCVVYGMPQAIVQAGLADQIISLDELSAHLIRGH